MLRECNRYVTRRTEGMRHGFFAMGKRGSLVKRIVETTVAIVERRVSGAAPCHTQDVENCTYRVLHVRMPQSEIHGDNFFASAPRWGPVLLARLFHNQRSLIETPRMLSFSAPFSSCCHVVRSTGVRAANERFTSKLGIGEFLGDASWPRHSKLLAGKCTPSKGLSRISATGFSSKDSAKEIDASTSDSNGSTEESPPEKLVNQYQKLKSEFEAAQRGFLHIPEAIRHIPKMDPNGVYANYNLRLDQIKVYGFDYDYTIAHYTDALQPLIYDLALKYLVNEVIDHRRILSTKYQHRYPETCLKFKYDNEFPIRGLYYDKKNGNLLKLDFFHSVEPHGCFFGRRRLSRHELEAQYGGKHINLADRPNLLPLMDLFCLSEACLISDVIQHFVDQNVEFDSAYVYDDVKRSIDHVHRSGIMHRTVLSDPVKYLVRNEAVVKMLQTLKGKGKKLFMLTNSPFPFVNGGMRYLFQEDGRSGESWRELFDVVFASADKPNFYTSERPFRHYSTKTDRLEHRKVEYFGKHAVYYHGCLKTFLDFTKWRGSEVLYFGDHLYTDLRGPAKAGWRTAAIIRELEVNDLGKLAYCQRALCAIMEMIPRYLSSERNETRLFHLPPEYEDSWMLKKQLELSARMFALDVQKEIMLSNEIEYRIQQARYNVVQELLGVYHKLPEETQIGDKQHILLEALRHERKSSRIAMRAQFNQYFGSCFLTDTGKESAFAYNVQRYADIYTSRLENLMKFSSEPWLYTPFDLKSLPHHIKVPPSIFKDQQ